MQAAQVLQMVASLKVPDFPKGPNLPSRDKFREWLRHAGGMVASCSEALMDDIGAISLDPMVSSDALAEWQTPLDRRLGSEILVTMDPKVVGCLDPVLVRSGYGLAILRFIARTVIKMTDKGLLRRLDMVRDPVPAKSKSELHRRIQQWILDVQDLTDEGHKPTDLDQTESFKIAGPDL